MKHIKPVLVVDPNPDRQLPYALLSENYSITRVADLQSADFLLEKENWAAVIIATTFPLVEKISFLEHLLQICRASTQVIPLIWIIDWALPVVELPGSSWGESVACWDENVSVAEINASFQRLGI